MMLLALDKKLFVNHFYISTLNIYDVRNVLEMSFACFIPSIWQDKNKQKAKLWKLDIQPLLLTA